MPTQEQTAMQQLIATFKEIEKDGYNITPTAAISLATELLEVERKQIIDARLSVTGLNHASPTDDNSLQEAEGYFNKTYNQ